MRGTACLISILLAASGARAEVPRVFGAVGRLEDAGEAVTAPTNVRVEVSAYGETDTVTPDSQGHFAASKGDGISVPDFHFSEARSFRFDVGGANLDPVFDLGPVPVAARAHRVTHVLPRLRVVENDGDPDASGSRLWSILNGELTPAGTAERPWVVQLDAGTYRTSASLCFQLDDYVSLVGAGRGATFLECSSSFTTLTAGEGARVAAMTIRGSDADALRVDGAGTVLEDLALEASGDPGSTLSSLDGLFVFSGAEVLARDLRVTVAADPDVRPIGIQAQAAGALRLRRASVAVSCSTTQDVIGISVPGLDPPASLRDLRVEVSNDSGRAIGLYMINNDLADVIGGSVVATGETSSSFDSTAIEVDASTATLRALGLELDGSARQLGGTLCGEDNLDDSLGPLDLGTCL